MSNRRARDGRLWVALWLWTAAWAAPHFIWSHALGLGSSWGFFPQGARILFSGGGLHLYARAPNLQIGPLAFLVAEPLRFAGPSSGRYVAVVLMTAAGPLVYALCTRVQAFGAFVSRGRLLAAGLGMLAVWPELGTHFGHLDDVLALLLTAAALVAIERRRDIAGALLLAAAVDCKPWAAAFAPLLFVLPRAVRVRAVVTWIVGVAVVWLPFVAADPNSLRAAHFNIGNTTVSGLRVFGIDSTRTPVWDRPVQILLGLAAAALLVRRGRWPGAILAAIACRLLLDPRSQTYYTSGAAVAAVLVDLWLTGLTVPLFTASTLLFLYADLRVGIEPHWLGIIRVAYCIGTVGVLLLAPLRSSGARA